VRGIPESGKKVRLEPLPSFRIAAESVSSFNLAIFQRLRSSVGSTSGPRSRAWIRCPSRFLESGKMSGTDQQACAEAQRSAFPGTDLILGKKTSHWASTGQFDKFLRNSLQNDRLQPVGGRQARGTPRWK